MQQSTGPLTRSGCQIFPAVSHTDESERERMRKDRDKWQDYLNRHGFFFRVVRTKTAVGTEGNMWARHKICDKQCLDRSILLPQTDDHSRRWTARQTSKLKNSLEDELWQRGKKKRLLLLRSNEMCVVMRRFYLLKASSSHLVIVHYIVA